MTPKSQTFGILPEAKGGEKLKYKISYLPSEEAEVAADLAVLRQLHPSAKVRESRAHPPFKHVYLQIPRPKEKTLEKDCDNSENVV